MSPEQTPVAAVLDRSPGSAETPTAPWYAEVTRSLATHTRAWLSEVTATPLSKDRAWTLLAWAEWAASRIVADRSAELVSASAFSFALLESSPLDRRDVMVVAALTRRACLIADLDFNTLVRAGCDAAGTPGAECLQWLWWASEKTPATHEELGSGPSFHFRRKPSDIDVAKLERWLEK